MTWRKVNNDLPECGDDVECGDEHRHDPYQTLDDVIEFCQCNRCGLETLWIDDMLVGWKYVDKTNVPRTVDQN